MEWKKVEYMGHLISKQRVTTNPRKVMVVQQRPMPKTIKLLWGFIGLAGYYRIFMKGCGIITRPLTNMLKKYSFYWSLEAKAAFQFER